MRRLQAEGFSDTPAWIWDELMDPFELAALEAMAVKAKSSKQATPNPPGGVHG